MGQFVLVGSWPQVTQLAAQLSGTSSTSSSSAPSPGPPWFSRQPSLWSLLFCLGWRNPSQALVRAGQARKSSSQALEGRVNRTAPRSKPEEAGSNN